MCLYLHNEGRKHVRVCLCVRSNGRNCVNRWYDQCHNECILPLTRGTLTNQSLCTVPNMRDLYGTEDAEIWYNGTLEQYQVWDCMARNPPTHTHTHTIRRSYPHAG